MSNYEVYVIEGAKNRKKAKIDELNRKIVWKKAQKRKFYLDIKSYSG